MEQNNNFNAEDSFIIGKDFEIAQTEEKEKKHRKRNKKSPSTAKNIIWVVSVVLISVLLAFFVIYAGADFMGIGFGRGEEVTMNIEMGTPASSIASELEEVGAVKMPFLFRIYNLHPAAASRRYWPGHRKTKT